MDENWLIDLLKHITDGLFEESGKELGKELTRYLVSTRIRSSIKSLRKKNEENLEPEKKLEK
ncbi:Uncharacterised protein [Mycobacterium tuberculosis]|nr:Uncharacterised protein [Mycobacterium tuberculosis]